MKKISYKAAATRIVLVMFYLSTLTGWGDYLPQACADTRSAYLAPRQISQWSAATLADQTAIWSDLAERLLVRNRTLNLKVRSALAFGLSRLWVGWMSVNGPGSARHVWYEWLDRLSKYPGVIGRSNMFPVTGPQALPVRQEHQGDGVRRRGPIESSSHWNSPAASGDLFNFTNNFFSLSETSQATGLATALDSRHASAVASQAWRFANDHFSSFSEDLQRLVTSRLAGALDSERLFVVPQAWRFANDHFSSFSEDLQRLVTSRLAGALDNRGESVASQAWRFANDHFSSFSEDLQRLVTSRLAGALGNRGEYVVSHARVFFKNHFSSLSPDLQATGLTTALDSRRSPIASDIWKFFKNHFSSLSPDLQATGLTTALDSRHASAVASQAWRFANDHFSSFSEDLQRLVTSRLAGALGSRNQSVMLYVWKFFKNHFSSLSPDLQATGLTTALDSRDAFVVSGAWGFLTKHFTGISEEAQALVTPTRLATALDSPHDSVVFSAVSFLDTHLDTLSEALLHASARALLVRGLRKPRVSHTFSHTLSNLRNKGLIAPPQYAQYRSALALRMKELGIIPTEHGVIQINWLGYLKDQGAGLRDYLLRPLQLTYEDTDIPYTLIEGVRPAHLAYVSDTEVPRDYPQAFAHLWAFDPGYRPSVRIDGRTFRALGISRDGTTAIYMDQETGVLCSLCIDLNRVQAEYTSNLEDTLTRIYATSGAAGIRELLVGLPQGLSAADLLSQPAIQNWFQALAPEDQSTIQAPIQSWEQELAQTRDPVAWVRKRIQRMRQQDPSQAQRYFGPPAANDTHPDWVTFLRSPVTSEGREWLNPLLNTSAEHVLYKLQAFHLLKTFRLFLDPNPLIRTLIALRDHGVLVHGGFGDDVASHYAAFREKINPALAEVTLEDPDYHLTVWTEGIPYDLAREDTDPDHPQLLMPLTDFLDRHLSDRDPGQGIYIWGHPIPPAQIEAGVLLPGDAYGLDPQHTGSMQERITDFMQTLEDQMGQREGDGVGEEEQAKALIEQFNHSEPALAFQAFRDFTSIFFRLSPDTQITGLATALDSPHANVSSRAWGFLRSHFSPDLQSVVTPTRLAKALDSPHANVSSRAWGFFIVHFTTFSQALQITGFTTVLDSRYAVVASNAWWFLKSHFSPDLQSVVTPTRLATALGSPHGDVTYSAWWFLTKHFTRISEEAQALITPTRLATDLGSPHEDVAYNVWRSFVTHFTTFSQALQITGLTTALDSPHDSVVFSAVSFLDTHLDTLSEALLHASARALLVRGLRKPRVSHTFSHTLSNLRNKGLIAPPQYAQYRSALALRMKELGIIPTEHGVIQINWLGYLKDQGPGIDQRLRPLQLVYEEASTPYVLTEGVRPARLVYAPEADTSQDYPEVFAHLWAFDEGYQKPFQVTQGGRTFIALGISQDGTTAIYMDQQTGALCSMCIDLNRVQAEYTSNLQDILRRIYATNGVVGIRELLVGLPEGISAPDLLSQPTIQTWLGTLTPGDQAFIQAPIQSWERKLAGIRDEVAWVQERIQRIRQEDPLQAQRYFGPPQANDTHPDWVPLLASPLTPEGRDWLGTLFHTSSEEALYRLQAFHIFKTLNLFLDPHPLIRILQVLKEGHGLNHPHVNASHYVALRYKIVPSLVEMTPEDPDYRLTVWTEGIPHELAETEEAAPDTHHPQPLSPLKDFLDHHFPQRDPTQDLYIWGHRISPEQMKTGVLLPGDAYGFTPQRTGSIQEQVTRFLQTLEGQMGTTEGDGVGEIRMSTEEVLNDLRFELKSGEQNQNIATADGLSVPYYALRGEIPSVSLLHLLSAAQNGPIRILMGPETYAHSRESLRKYAAFIRANRLSDNLSMRNLLQVFVMTTAEQERAVLTADEWVAGTVDITSAVSAGYLDVVRLDQVLIDKLGVGIIDFDEMILATGGSIGMNQALRSGLRIVLTIIDVSGTRISTSVKATVGQWLGNIRHLKDFA